MPKLQNYSDDLLLFAQIIRSGSLSAAASQLGLGRSAVSKRLISLEQRVGSRLLQRTTRKMSLTGVGEEVLAEAQVIEQALNSVVSISENHQQQYTGRVKVSCSSALGRRLLVPLLKQFNEQYPGISVNLQLEDRFVDLIKEQVDVSIRVGHLSDSTLIARKLGNFSWHVCASPSYLAKYGEPKNLAELKEQGCLCYQNSESMMNVWGFNGPNGEEQVTVPAALTINDADALVAAAIEGFGILLVDQVASRHAIESGQLVNVLTDYKPMAGFPIYVVYPAREFVPARVRAFIDFVMKEMRPLI